MSNTQVDEEIKDKLTELVTGQEGVHFYELEDAAKYTVDGLEAVQLNQVLDVMQLIQNARESHKGTEELDKYCKERARHIVSGFRNVIDVSAISDIQNMIWAELMTAGQMHKGTESQFAENILNKLIEADAFNEEFTLKELLKIVRDSGKGTEAIPPEGCICASFWTIRQTHKPDCPLSKGMVQIVPLLGTREGETLDKPTNYAPEIRQLAYAMESMSFVERCAAIAELADEQHNVGLKNGRFGYVKKSEADRDREQYAAEKVREAEFKLTQEFLHAGKVKLGKSYDIDSEQIGNHVRKHFLKLVEERGEHET